MTPYEPPLEPLSGDWNEDKAKIFKLAQTPTSAQEFPTLVQSVHALFRALAPAAVSPLGIEQRVGLSRKIHNELYPLSQPGHRQQRLGHPSRPNAGDDLAGHRRDPP